MDPIITIDGAGRLVIPKEIRRRHGLSRGSRLRLVDNGGCLVLTPIEHIAQVEERGGVLVVMSPIEGPWADHRALREERADRSLCLE